MVETLECLGVAAFRPNNGRASMPTHVVERSDCAVETSDDHNGFAAGKRRPEITWTGDLALMADEQPNFLKNG
jgi:hypothetical protein